MIRRFDSSVATQEIVTNSVPAVARADCKHLSTRKYSPLDIHDEAATAEGLSAATAAEVSDRLRSKYSRPETTIYRSTSLLSIFCVDRARFLLKFLHRLASRSTDFSIFRSFC